MKKMLNFKYVIVGFLLVLCGACSDFLDLEPKNKIPGEKCLVGSQWYQVVSS